VGTLDVYRTLWRRRFVILFLTFVTVVAAYVVVSGETKIYRSTIFIRVQQQAVDPTQVGNAIGVAQHLAQTYAQIATTDAIGDSVFRVLHGKVPRDQIKLSAQPVQDLELLYISAKSSNPQWAADAANAAPVALRSWIASTTAKTDRDQIQVVNPAGRGVSPISPNVKLGVIIALLAGLFFNGSLAVLIEFLSDRLRGVDEIEALTGRSILATIPVLEFAPSAVTAVQDQLARARALSAAAETALSAEPKRTRG
jgi:capsular polysaccharide biosynthesis protein